jgi:predicted transcriptional regulator of viral defense system
MLIIFELKPMANNKIATLLRIESPFLTLSSLQAIFDLTRESARTTASRLVKKGVLLRITRNLYVLAGRKYSLFSLANALHQPSVISLETALNYWGLIVQVPQIIFSVALGSFQSNIDNTEFVYRRIDPSLFHFGQKKVEDFYVAEPEKAFLDSLYMKSKGLVELLPEDVDLGKLDIELVDFYSRPYPDTVKKMFRLYREQSYEAK